MTINPLKAIKLHQIKKEQQIRNETIAWLSAHGMLKSTVS